MGPNLGFLGKLGESSGVTSENSAGFHGAIGVVNGAGDHAVREFTPRGAEGGRARPPLGTDMFPVVKVGTIYQGCKLLQNLGHPSKNGLKRCSGSGDTRGGEFAGREKRGQNLVSGP